MDFVEKAVPYIRVLLLARYMARAYGECEFTAVRICARRIEPRVRFYPMFRKLLNGIVDQKNREKNRKSCLATLDQAEASWRASGVY